MTELLVATRNKKKLEEIKDLLKDFDIKVTSLADYSGMPTIDEDGKTFKENALKKAATIALYTKKLTLGEDSGLQVKALRNEPGIYSARFSGPDATDPKNNQKLLRLLRGVPLKKRQARYRCSVALVDAQGIIDVVEGSCSGVIDLKLKGSNGFGYDPLFLIPRYKKTFGELDPVIKAKISHRAKALAKFKKVLKKYLAGKK
ncbi:MAG TPA: RdgB/HAM1 family non-canonical purine NTP pyrophosphatase [Candidatus Omnitrophota bacterium]|nr:RdgB/HAM1 family non-canonical purine NTP pyrophosphatase [Candidatus Omnitrophota bacterium]HPD84710.1 RdgB/HAM1 family non-canonical purine NTP pyrophosphatase [Candidatus Omnitrophota bacterium]HRZ03568.1 RdgB/HAM1 family non-canonical purine NTP pyrophosphatase [Candidatus Omnitrophota bacterium]